METTQKATPTERWGLSEHCRATVDGSTWVIYDDDTYTTAVLAADYDAPTIEADYSHWCSATTAVVDRDTAERLLVAAEFPGLHIGGSLEHVEHPEWRKDHGTR